LATGLIPASDITAFCDEVAAAGWALVEEYNVLHPGTQDTDNAHLYRSGQDCLLAMHGMDVDEFFNKGYSKYGPVDSYYGVSDVGLSEGLTEELEVILIAIRDRHGSLASWTASCPGAFTVTGHSMGGGMAAILGYLANLAGDPLNMNKRVSQLLLFAPMPPATTPLTDGQSEGGCFSGTHYYTFVPAGVAAGYGAFADLAELHGYFKGGMVSPMVPWTPLQVVGPSNDPANLLGVGEGVACGGTPPVYPEMAKNMTLLAKAEYEFMRALHPADPKVFGLHELPAYVDSFPPMSSAAPTATPMATPSPTAVPLKCPANGWIIECDDGRVFSGASIKELADVEKDLHVADSGKGDCRRGAARNGRAVRCPTST
jgi:hypothetical protein